MSPLESVRRFVVPYAEVLAPSLSFLREVGQAKREGILAWGGRLIDEGTFRFSAAYAPKQTAYATEDGLLVRVESEALHQLNVRFNDLGIILGGRRTVTQLTPSIPTLTI
jgi:hypothetical protein